MATGLKDAAAVQKGQIESETAAFFADPLQGGMLSMEKAGTNLEEAELGEDRATIAPYMQRAKTNLAALEANPMAKTWTARSMRCRAGGAVPRAWDTKGFEQAETASAMGEIRRQAEAAGIDTSAAPSVATGSQRGNRKPLHGRAGANDEGG